MALEYVPGCYLWTCFLVSWPQGYPTYSCMQFLATLAVPQEALGSAWIIGLEGTNSKVWKGSIGTDLAIM